MKTKTRALNTILPRRMTATFLNCYKTFEQRIFDLSSQNILNIVYLILLFLFYFYRIHKCSNVPNTVVFIVRKEKKANRGEGAIKTFHTPPSIRDLTVLVTEKFLFWTFQGREIRPFLKTKSWWKDGIYWLLKSSCFKLFGDEKYGSFWDKKLMERWYLLITKKFLFWATKKFLFWAFWWWKVRSFF